MATPAATIGASAQEKLDRVARLLAAAVIDEKPRATVFEERQEQEAYPFLRTLFVVKKELEGVKSTTAEPDRLKAMFVDAVKERTLSVWRILSVIYILYPTEEVQLLFANWLLTKDDVACVRAHNALVVARCSSRRTSATSCARCTSRHSRRMRG